MEITSDVPLKGGLWRKALQVFAPFFPQSLQPNYSIYVLSMSIGIMYDKQLEMAGDEVEDETRPSVPRTVLYSHNTDLDFLFQSAILTSSNVDFDEEQRMDLAFNSDCKTKFNRLDFLTKFANYGVTKLLKQSSDEPVETMEQIKRYLASIVEGYNYEINSISDEDIGIEDL